MECFLATLLLLFTLGAILFAAVSNRWARHVRVEQHLAKHFGGTRVARRLWMPSSVRIRYGQTYAVVTRRRRRAGVSEEQIVVRIAWPGSARCQIRCRTPHESNPAGWNGVATGDSHFDDQFVVQAKDAQKATRLLVPNVRWQMMRLNQLQGWDLSVRFDRHWLIISKQFDASWYRTMGEPFVQGCLVQFVQGCLSLYDQAMLTQVEGIEFVESEAAQLIIEAVCQVCGESIEQEMVVCRSCKTPHHLDCWQYFGACSTFACQEKQFDLPAEASSVTFVPAPDRTSP